MQLLLLILILLCLVPLIKQPKCPSCHSKSILLFKGNYKCTKCGKGFDDV